MKTGDVDADRAAEGPDDLHRHLAGLRRAGRPALLHDRQRRVSRPGAARSRRPARRRCCRRTRASASSPSTRPIDRSGASGTSTACARSSGWRRRTRSGRACVTLPYGTIVYDLDVSPDGTKVVGGVRRDRRQDGRARLRDRGRCSKATTTPDARFDFGHAVPSGFVFSPDGRFLYGTAYLTGVSNVFRYELATGADRGRQQHRDRVLPSDPARRRRADRLPLHRPRPACPRASPARRSRTPRRSRFSASGWPRRSRSCSRGSSGRRPTIPWETMPKKEGVYRLAGGLKSESFYPIVQGYKDSPAVGMRWNLSDPLQLNRLSLSASYSPDTGLPWRANGCTCGPHYQRYDWRADAPLERRRLLRSVRADQDRPQGLRRRASGASGRSSTTSRGGWSSTSTGRIRAISIGCPTTRTCRWTWTIWSPSTRSWASATSATRWATSTRRPA